MPRRPIIIANCSGANLDQGFQMARQIKNGPIDAVYGDYLAEMNLSDNARAYREGKHPGWEKTAEDGILQSLPLIKGTNIKIVVNGGALNPAGLAHKVHAAVVQQDLGLKVAYVSGDELIDRAKEFISHDMKHLDSAINKDIKVDKLVTKFLDRCGSGSDSDSKGPQDCAVRPVSCNAYLGARAILKGLEQNADIIICGRVSDASPVIALASWWHGWTLLDYDQLAGALVAGHLTECSGYTTGANFCDFYRYRPLTKLLDIGYPIAEIASDGSFVVTKHPGLNGVVNSDTCRCQFLYELQGNEYLNSDVKALLRDIEISDIGKNRVLVKGIKGAPPPPTTKLALFYDSGYQCEFTICATGTAEEVDAKFDLQKAQFFKYLTEDNSSSSSGSSSSSNLLDRFDVLEFQRFAHPDANADTQFAGTSFLRIVAQAAEQETLYHVAKGFKTYGMQHFSGLHHVMDVRLLVPKPINTFYPSIIDQQELNETVTILLNNNNDNSNNTAAEAITFPADRIQKFEPLKPRVSYETANPLTPAQLATEFGPLVCKPLSSFVLARSGDKGSNVNIGLFVHRDDEYRWLTSYLTCDRLKQLMGKDWQSWFYVERVEMPKIYAVHFVVYGLLGRGVSSSTRIDALGKGFADWIRSRTDMVPEKFVKRYEGVTYTIE